MVLQDWQRGKLPYFADPDQYKKEELKDENEEKSPAEEKRIEIESKLKLEHQDFKEIKKQDLPDEEEEENNQETQEPEDEEEDDEDIIKEEPDMEYIDANADQEDQLKKLDEQLKMLKQRNQAMDDSRLGMIDKVKSTAPYMASIEDGYGAKKAIRNNKRRNVDLEEEEAKAVAMEKKLTSKERRRIDRENKEQKGDNYYSKANIK